MTARLFEVAGKAWLRCLLLFLVGVAVRAPALEGELIWDDEVLVRGNAFIKSPLLILEAFRHYLFVDSFAAHYRPVQNASFAFDYLIWSNTWFGYHLTNVLLHAGSGVLLYLLLSRLLPSMWKQDEATAGRRSLLAAFLIALVWSVHPVHSAAVDYISGRADSLAFLFASAGWLSVLVARQSKSRGQVIALNLLAFALGLLALCSREIALVWILLFLLHRCVWDGDTSRRAKLVALASCVALLAIYVGLRQLPDERAAPGPSHGWSGARRAVLVLRSLGDYGRLMIFPSNLHMERTVVRLDDRLGFKWRIPTESDYLMLGGVVVMGVLALGSCRNGACRKMRAWGASWFVLAYLPVSNVFELNATVAEHWLYLPSVGFLIFLAGVVLEMRPHVAQRLAIFVGLAAIALSARSLARSSDWVDAQTFYERNIAAGGMSTRIAVNLARIYAQHGEQAKAEKLFRDVLQMTPGYPPARTNLGKLLLEEGRKEEADALFAQASADAVISAKQYPRPWMGALYLAQLRRDENPREALALLEKADREYPNVWPIVRLRVELLRQDGQTAAAFAVLEEFARTHWWHYEAALTLGRCYAVSGDAARAVDALSRASRLDVHAAEPRDLIAAIHRRIVAGTLEQ